VQTHLKHVFGKLGISTRAQLAAEVARQPPSAPPN
jgi:DNA-binding CsgD family transcriptional regulator